MGEAEEKEVVRIRRHRMMSDKRKRLKRLLKKTEDYRDEPQKMDPYHRDGPWNITRNFETFISSDED